MAHGWFGRRRGACCSGVWFARVSCCVPRVHLADPVANAEAIEALYRRAAMLGSADAAYALGRLEPDAVAAREYFVVAARRGHRLAAAALRGEG